MGDGKKYKIVEIQADDRAEAFRAFGVNEAYTLDKWDNVLIVEVTKDFNINRHAAALQKTFGFGANRPVVITRSPMNFFRVEAVTEQGPGFWSKLWSGIKGWFAPRRQS